LVHQAARQEVLSPSSDYSDAVSENPEIGAECVVRLGLESEKHLVSDSSWQETKGKKLRTGRSGDGGGVQR